METNKVLINKKLMMKNKLIYSLLLICLTLGLASCKDSNDASNGRHMNETKLRFFLKVPNENIVNTRAYNQEDTYKIEPKELQILLFENDKFYKNCKVEEVKVAAAGEDKEYEIKIDIPHNNKNVDIVVIANSDINGANLVPEQTSKEEFYGKLVYLTKGAWGSKLLPMWGEIKNIKLTEDVGTKFSKEMLSVVMMRSIARIDLSYEPNSEFTVKSALLYNTLDRGTIAPSEENIVNSSTGLKVNKPSVAASALYNVNTGSASANVETAQQSPIEVPFIESKGSPILTFIPEQENKQGANNRPTVVLAIHNKNEKEGQLSYYKIDLEVLDGQGGRTPIAILRNHKYIITINSITGKGYDNPIDALKGEATNIDVEVVRWQDNINQGYIFGSKYFGIETTNIQFEEAIEGQKKFFKYQSNMDDIDSNIRFTWEKGGLFKANNAYNDTDKEQLIQVTTLTENRTNEVLEDRLIIDAIGHKFYIDVTQNTAKADYYLNCESVKVTGIYSTKTRLETVVDKAKKPMNYIEVDAIANSRSLILNKRYEVKTENIDGIEFYGSGLFTNSELKDIEGGKVSQTIRLYAKGSTNSKFVKKFTIIPNSLTPSICEATVKMTFRPMKIYMASNSSSSGFSSDQSVTKEIREYTLNFGLEKDSKVKIPPMYDVRDSRYSSLTSEQKRQVTTSDFKTRPTASDLRRELATADIFIIGYTYTPTDDASCDAIADFLVKRRGVLIMFNETRSSVAAIFQAIYKKIDPTKNLNIDSKSAGGAGTIYPIVTQPGDPIFDGPFNVNGQRVKYWGEDRTTTKTIIGLPEEDIVVYSRSVSAGGEESENDKGITMCRHTKVNVFFSGDGGFIAQSGDSKDLSARPVWVVNKNMGDYTPTYKPLYGSSGAEGRTEVGNAIIFANALAWAFEKAEFEVEN